MSVVRKGLGWSVSFWEGKYKLVLEPPSTIDLAVDGELLFLALPPALVRLIDKGSMLSLLRELEEVLDPVREPTEVEMDALTPAQKDLLRLKALVRRYTE